MDTIIIKIYGPGKFKFRNKSLFLPEITYRKYEDLSPTEVKSRSSSRPYLRKFILHSNVKDEYIPAVEIFETLPKKMNTVVYIMKITFSAPKLLFWNSIQEVIGIVPNVLISKLRRSLERVGIDIEKDTFENAVVEAVHFCKNILLPKTIKMREILDELAKVDMSKAVDTTERIWKNGGQVLNLYSGIAEHIFYEKIADSQKTKNKRSDKNHILYEREIIKRYGLENKEIFRYEYRIKKTQTVKSRLNKMLNREPKTIVVFKDLFLLDLSKKMLLDSWNNITRKPENQLALFESSNDLEILLHIFAQAKKNNPGAYGMNVALNSYAISGAIQRHSVKEIKKLVSTHWSKDHPERFTKKIKVASELMQGISYKGNIAFIDKSLKEFEVINLASLEKSIII